MFSLEFFGLYFHYSCLLRRCNSRGISSLAIVLSFSSSFVALFARNFSASVKESKKLFIKSSKVMSEATKYLIIVFSLRTLLVVVNSRYTAIVSLHNIFINNLLYNMASSINWVSSSLCLSWGKGILWSYFFILSIVCGETCLCASSFLHFCFFFILICNIASKTSISIGSLH